MRATIMNNQQCAGLPNYSKFGKIGSFTSPLNKMPLEKRESLRDYKFT